MKPPPFTGRPIAPSRLPMRVIDALLKRRQPTPDAADGKQHDACPGPVETRAPGSEPPRRPDTR